MTPHPRDFSDLDKLPALTPFELMEQAMFGDGAPIIVQVETRDGRIATLLTPHITPHPLGPKAAPMARLPKPPLLRTDYH